MSVLLRFTWLITLSWMPVPVSFTLRLLTVRTTFYTCKRYGMSNDDIMSPVQSYGVYVADLPFFGGQFIWKANANIVVRSCKRLAP